MQKKNTNIYTYPHPVLLTPCEPVDEINQEIRDILDEMTHVMRVNDGIGLAAPQIGITKRLVTVWLNDILYQVINPQITWQNGYQKNIEGCLSLPKQSFEVERAQDALIEGFNPEKKRISFLTSGLLACVFQHETDHLEGILINFVGELVVS